MGRSFTLHAKIARGLDDSASEKLLPYPVNKDPGSQGMIFIQEPLGQSQSVFGKLSRIKRKNGRRHIGGDGFTVRIVLASFQNIRWSSNGTVAHDHDVHLPGIFLVDEL